jgi:hypothetical protein
MPVTKTRSQSQLDANMAPAFANRGAYDREPDSLWENWYMLPGCKPKCTEQW